MATNRWLDRHPILHPDHANDLERDAAVHEFGENALSRDEAETKAYDDYKHKNMAQSAAHHLAGMRASAGKESQKHGLMYALHVRAMGYDPSGPVPAEVTAHMNSDDFRHPVKFKPHPGDALLFNDTDTKKSERTTEDRFDALKKAANIGIALEVVRRLSVLKKTAKSAILLEKLLKGNPMGMNPAFRHKMTGQMVVTPGFHDDSQLPGGEFTDDWEDGFVDHTNRFYDRHQAAAALGRDTSDTVDSWEVDPANPAYDASNDPTKKGEKVPEKHNNRRQMVSKLLERHGHKMNSEVERTITTLSDEEFGTEFAKLKTHLESTKKGEDKPEEKKLKLELPSKEKEIIASIKDKMDKLFEPDDEVGPSPSTLEAFKKLLGG